MTRTTPVVIALATLALGCANPSVVKPKAGTATAAAHPALGAESDLQNVTVGVSVTSPPYSERLVQFVGGTSGVGGYNDVATLIVGLFDAGSTVAPALGYKYSSPFGSPLAPGALPTPITGSTWLPDLENARLNSSPDSTNERRYLVREYTSGLSTASSISVTFNNLPNSVQHNYLSFAAAYDGDGYNIGFTTGSVPPSDITHGIATSSTELDLPLNNNLYRAGLTAAATFSDLYPSAQ